MSWGLLAKTDAVHPPHIDRPGTATFIAVEDGLKKWDVAFPPEEGAEEEVANPAAFGVEMTGETITGIGNGIRYCYILELCCTFPCPFLCIRSDLQ